MFFFGTPLEIIAPHSQVVPNLMGQLLWLTKKDENFILQWIGVLFLNIDWWKVWRCRVASGG
jgi:hypothetical protein